jgi:hypothetical protein
VLPLTQKPGQHDRDRISLFAAYLREYGAKILESAGWSQCPPERVKLCEGHNAAWMCSLFIVARFAPIPFVMTMTRDLSSPLRMDY